MTVDPTQPAVQLRIGFHRPSAPAVVELTLAGLVVLVEAGDRRSDDVWQHLTAVGVEAAPHPSGSLAFPVAQLPRLRDLPDQVVVSVDDDLAPLWALATNPPPNAVPATLAAEGATLRLRWHDGILSWDERLPRATAPALLAVDLPFVGTSAAWELLKDASTVPVLAGRCKMNLDGYVEIETAKPQLVESSPLKGLIRLDDTHFGLPLPYVGQLKAAPGFVWDGPPPHLDRAPRGVEMPVPLSDHVADAAAELADRLASFGAAAVVWDPGLGRRVAVLAALETLDAWPALIVVPPSSVWLWQRHLELFGRSGALTHNRADARIVTYLDLAMGAAISDPAAIVLDELWSPEAASAPARAAVRRLDGVRDAYRLTVSAAWPDNVTDAVKLCALLRPGEFRADLPPEVRYPAPALDRAADHVAAYLVRRERADTSPAGHGFRRSTVTTVQPSAAQLDALSRIAERSDSSTPAAVLAESLELCSVGSTSSTSPKLAACVDAVKRAVAAGRRPVVVTRFRRGAFMLSLLLRPLALHVAEENDGTVEAPDNADVVVVRFDRRLPSLRNFDEVIVMDMPFSAQVLDAAVGTPVGDTGPTVVRVLHMTGTVEDRLVMLAARRRELVGLTEDALTAEEIDHLLAPRWTPPKSAAPSSPLDGLGPGPLSFVPSVLR